MIGRKQVCRFGVEFTEAPARRAGSVTADSVWRDRAECFESQGRELFFLHIVYKEIESNA
jgi:nuclear transport factor 2 (NTF2) superfamily protein